MRRAEHLAIPVIILARVVVDIPKLVFALWRSNERRAAFAVSKGWSNDSRPCIRREVGWLVQHHIIEIQTAHSVVIIRAEQPQSPAVWIVDAKLRHVHGDVRD